MTVLLYGSVLSVVDDTPRTTDEIVEILFKDLRYKSDKRAKRDAVSKALRQLIEDGKVVMEKRMRDEYFVPTYYLKTKRGPRPPQTRYEYTLSLMEDGKWYSASDLVSMIYEKPDVHGVYYCRVSRSLRTLLDKGLVIKRPTGEKNLFGTPLMEYRSVV